MPIVQPTPKRVFDGEFFNYWHFVKSLTEEQRQSLAATLSKEEQKELITSFKKGGWQHFFMRNACDQVLDGIKKKFGIDWLAVKAKILKGKPQLVQKSFWNYLNQCFNGSDIDWDHIAYIFDGLIAHDFDDEYIKVSLFEPIITENDNSDNEGESDTKGE